MGPTRNDPKNRMMRIHATFGSLRTSFSGVFRQSMKE